MRIVMIFLQQCCQNSSCHPASTSLPRQIEMWHSSTCIQCTPAAYISGLQVLRWFKWFFFFYGRYCVPFDAQSFCSTLWFNLYLCDLGYLHTKSEAKRSDATMPTNVKRLRAERFVFWVSLTQDEKPLFIISWFKLCAYVMKLYNICLYHQYFNALILCDALIFVIHSFFVMH